MSALPDVAVLNPVDARALTDEIKADAAALWAKLLEAYDGKAHIALGYSSWGEYYAAEFGQSGTHGYRLLDSARVVEVLHSPIGESVARELAPLRNEPEALRETWAEVVDLHGDKPTAAQVKEVVEQKRPDRMAVHYSSQTDEWATPQDLFDALHAEFNFTTDVCALESSAKCEHYFTPETDGLAQDWTGTCWMNPPYGDVIGQWVKKAHDSALDGATVVCLVPARVDTGWWWDYCRYGEVRFLKGRLKFGDSPNSAPFPSAVVVFGAEPRVVWWER